MIFLTRGRKGVVYKAVVVTESSHHFQLFVLLDSNNPIGAQLNQLFAAATMATFKVIIQSSWLNVSSPIHPPLLDFIPLKQIALIVVALVAVAYAEEATHDLEVAETKGKGMSYGSYGGLGGYGSSYGGGYGGGYGGSSYGGSSYGKYLLEFTAFLSNYRFM